MAYAHAVYTVNRGVDETCQVLILFHVTFPCLLQLNIVRTNSAGGL